MRSNKNRSALIYRIIAIVLAGMMVLSAATYVFYALFGLI